MQHEIPPHSPDNPVCPLCELEVFPGDSVIFSHGEIVHIKCRVTNEGIGSLALLFQRSLLLGGRSLSSICGRLATFGLLARGC